ncbi:MAG TPA: heme-degrading domain-containing protein [Rectinemataceae bacterium]|nr:heme-degrading domain-containing protein [Rectinemataceae bacterium]
MPTDIESLIATIEAQEAELQFASFSNDEALELGLLLVRMARERGAAVAIDISRGSQRLFHYAFAGTSADNDAWIERKKAVVARFGRSSFLIGRRLERDGLGIAEKFFVDPREYSPHGGAVPIILRGTGPVGVVAVSGLPQAEDHELVVAALRAYLQAATPLRG